MKQTPWREGHISNVPTGAMFVHRVREVWSRLHGWLDHSTTSPARRVGPPWPASNCIVRVQCAANVEWLDPTCVVYAVWFTILHYSIKLWLGIAIHACMHGLGSCSTMAGEVVIWWVRRGREGWRIGGDFGGAFRGQSRARGVGRLSRARAGPHVLQSEPDTCSWMDSCSTVLPRSKSSVVLKRCLWDGYGFRMTLFQRQRKYVLPGSIKHLW